MNKEQYRINRQRFLVELLESLLAMEKKELIEGWLKSSSGYCALGVVAKCRGIDLSLIIGGEKDIGDPVFIGLLLNIHPQLAYEIMSVNDRVGSDHETRRQRYTRVVRWIRQQLEV